MDEHASRACEEAGTAPSRANRCYRLESAEAVSSIQPEPLNESAKSP